MGGQMALLRAPEDTVFRKTWDLTTHGGKNSYVVLLVFTPFVLIGGYQLSEEINDSKSSALIF